MDFTRYFQPAKGYRMEAKIREIQPMIAENWVRYDTGPQDTQLIQPVVKTETSSQVKTDNDSKSRHRGVKTNIDPQASKELAEEVKNLIEDLNIGVNFKIHDKTGDLVVQVLNRDTGDVIRQIPPEDVVKLHEKLVELRGVLYEGKA
jgi:flagellar protein FlaG